MAALNCMKYPLCGRQRRAGDKRQHGYDDVDGPYAWVVALAAFFGHVFIFGILWSSGVFYDLFRELFDGPSWMLSLISTLSTAFTYGFSPVPGVLINKYGHRIMTMVGGCIAGTGLVLSSYAPNMYYLIASFGVITGIGFGTAYLAVITIVPLYFDKYRTIALGLVVSGVGIGTFLYPPLLRYLVHGSGIRGSLLITGALTFNICVCGAIMRPPRKPKLNKKRPAEMADEYETSTEKSLSQQRPSSTKNNSSCLSLLNFHIFKHSSYLILCFSNFLCIFGLSIMYVHITAYSETKNVNKDTAAMLVSALGISNSIGRPVFGLLAKVPCCSSLILYATSFTFCGVVVLLIPLMRDFTGVLVLTCAFGFLSASIGPLLPQLITEFLSIDLIPSGYGYVLAFEAVGSLTGPPAAGWLYDILKLYAPSFYLSGATLGISGAMMIIPYFIQKRTLMSAKHANVLSIDIELDDKNDSLITV